MSSSSGRKEQNKKGNGPQDFAKGSEWQETWHRLTHAKVPWRPQAVVCDCSLQLTPQISRVPRKFVSRPKLLALSGRARMVRWFICVVLGTRIDVSSSDVDVAVGRRWSPGIICRVCSDPHSSSFPANMTRNARALSLTCDTPAAARFFFFVSFSTVPTADEVPDGFAAIASSSYMRLREQFSGMELGSTRRGCGTLRVVIRSSWFEHPDTPTRRVYSHRLCASRY